MKILVFKKYSETYEEGRCPLGYEYVESYRDRSGTFHRSYCRKIKKVSFTDPEEKYEKQIKKSEDDSIKNAKKIIEKSDNHPEPSGDFSERGL